jgi:ubiquinone/menaquinone biosynthesis C-methylase UbiE
MSGDTSGTFKSVNQAFSKQASHFDEEDASNSILQDLRTQVYSHVEKYLGPNSKILELNSGTGIDALHFIKGGHSVHATDLSDGMILQIQNKIQKFQLQKLLTVQQVSFDDLEEVAIKNFDFIFSNFGGLNCIRDLSGVTRHLPGLLKPGAYVTWVIMPHVYLWEIATILKLNRNAFRRLSKTGVTAHLEGHYFSTYYHSLSEIKKAFGKSFSLIATEGLAAISPPPHAFKFQQNHKRLYKKLRYIDSLVRKTFPFNQWADHIIVTFQYKGD